MSQIYEQKQFSTKNEISTNLKRIPTHINKYRQKPTTSTAYQKILIVDGEKELVAESTKNGYKMVN